MTTGEAIARRETFRFGELTVTFGGQGAVIHGLRGETPETEVDSSPDALRGWVRADDGGRYRPLPGARTMRTGWRARCRGETELLAALDAVYPLALRHVEQWEAGALRIVGLEEVLARQSGRYEGSAKASEEARATASKVLCGQCVKAPVWRGDVAGPGDIPCPEPCGLLVSLCREAAAWEKDQPAPAAVDRTIGFAQFEEPGNEVREAYLAVRYAAARGPVRRIEQTR